MIALGLAAFAAFAQPVAEGTVTVPLAAWEARLAAATAAPTAPRSVTLGAATWSGAADPETLALVLDGTLRVSLVGAGRAEVPLIGPEAVLTSVEVDGAPVGVDRGATGHVWPTDAVGDHVVRIRALVPPSGQRGAVEYDFGVPQSASTALSLTLPRPNLRPELADAARTRVESVGDTTRVTADLASTGRIRLLGLRDLEVAEAREPKLYAESAHLVAVDERRIELFSVLKYTILYAGARRFDVFVPEGLTVASVDGEGAYAWEAVPADGGTLIRGETAYPMRNRYEISLRLTRELPTAAAELVLPHAVGVEREHGWVGIEAPGRVRLEEVVPNGLVAVDPGMLPAALRDASVSPLLHGLRTSGAGAVRIRATPLPEVEVDAERVDRVEARTVVSASGRAATELTVTLRNRLRHALLLTLPEGAEVTRAFLDGAPVVPSRTAEGRVAVPLRRSAPDQPFQVVVVLAHDATTGWFGRTTLELPALDLPVTALRWDVGLPEGRHWTALRSDVTAQTQVGTGRWMGDQGSPVEVVPMPAQVAVQDEAVARTFDRYWVPAGAPVRVWSAGVPTLVWVARWPAGAFAGLLGLVALSWAARPVRRAGH